MLIKKFIFLTICVFLCVFSLSSVSSALDISARSAVLINAQNNEIIFEKNKDERLSMASTTKIMTSLLAIESGRLPCVVTAKNDVNCEGTSISIKKGDSFTLKTLVYAMLLESGNDAAILTAEYLSGSEKEFSYLMNKKATDIGMISTNFVTSSGLDDEKHFSTAYDMALLGSYSIKNPHFRKICSTESYNAEYITPEINVTYRNHNRLLDYYDGVLGIKTGFTKKSGRCLVSACERDGMTLVAVTLNAPDDWNDHIKMYDYGFSAVQNQSAKIIIPDKVKVYGSDKITVNICTENKAFPQGKITYKLHLKKWCYAPVKAGDVLGYAVIYLDGKEIEKVLIFSEENAASLNINNKPKFNFGYRIKKILS